MISQMQSLTSSRLFSGGPEAMRESKISHEDVDHLMIYDAFAHLPIYGLEDLGSANAAKHRVYRGKKHCSRG